MEDVVRMNVGFFVGVATLPLKLAGIHTQCLSYTYKDVYLQPHTFFVYFITKEWLEEYVTFCSNGDSGESQSN